MSPQTIKGPKAPKDFSTVSLEAPAPLKKPVVEKKPFFENVKKHLFEKAPVVSSNFPSAMVLGGTAAVATAATTGYVYRSALIAMIPASVKATLKETKTFVQMKLAEAAAYVTPSDDTMKTLEENSIYKNVKNYILPYLLPVTGGLIAANGLDQALKVAKKGDKTYQVLSAAVKMATGAAAAGANTYYLGQSATATSLVFGATMAVKMVWNSAKSQSYIKSKI